MNPVEATIKRLGRFEVRDERDNDFLLKDVLPVMESAGDSYRYWWASGWWGDQGMNPWCVAYSWLHWLEDGPVTHFYENRSHDPSYMPGSHDPLISPQYLYHEAQLIDQWPGEDYDGTSVRAGAKILMQNGLISEYRWAWDVETAVQALLTKGPLVVGTTWFVDMFYPDSKGFIKPTGGRAGGHAYVINGVNTKKGFVRLKNSWGRSWGHNGYAYMTIDDFATLIEDGGEVCMATETRKED